MEKGERLIPKKRKWEKWLKYRMVQVEIPKIGIEKEDWSPYNGR